MNQKKVLGVIGLGHVGAHVAYSLAVQGIADELVLVDGNAQKLASEATQILRLNNEQNLRYLNILACKK